MTQEKELTEQELLDNAVKKQYVWEKEVVKIDGKHVEFADWSVEVFTKEQLKYIVTDEPKDATEQRDLMLKNLVPNILDALEKHNIRKWDLQAIFDVVFDSYNQSRYLAVAKAFGTYREWVNLQTLVEDIRVSDIKREMS